MKFSLFIVLIGLSSATLFAQDLDQRLKEIKTQIDLNEEKHEALEHKATLLNQINDQLKLKVLQLELAKYGHPTGAEGEKVTHQAMVISYNEEHEQANWVFHKILPDVAEGNFTRTNDFRIDSAVSTLSSFQEDYFLVEEKPNGEKVYDGFGYDRGHLAPSADFRWHQSSLSESYFYSNMAPQDPLLNRERWAELEGMLRGYVIRTKHPLYVVTGPILRDGLPKVSRSVNGLSIPEYFFKAVYDPIDGQSIAFILKNNYCKKRLRHYAVSIDSVEMFSGLDLFPNMENQEKVETKYSFNHWLPDGQQNEAAPMTAADMPSKAINTEEAKEYMNKGKKVMVCGKVVSTKKSKKGNVFLNLDKPFPNHVFSVTIWNSNAVNFSYEPHTFLMNQQVCIKGKIGESQGIPTINVEKEEAIQLLDDPELSREKD